MIGIAYRNVSKYDKERVERVSREKQNESGE